MVINNFGFCFAAKEKFYRHILETTFSIWQLEKNFGRQLASKSLFEILEKFFQCLETQNSKLDSLSLKIKTKNSSLKTQFSKASRIENRVSRENLRPWYSLESSFGFSAALESISGKWANAEMCKRNAFPASVKCGDYNMKYEISTINWDLNFDVNTAPYCTPYIRENTPNLMWQNTARLKQYGCLTTRRGASKHFIACNQRVL